MVKVHNQRPFWHILPVALVYLFMLVSRLVTAENGRALPEVGASLRTILAGIDHYEFEPFFGSSPGPDILSLSLFRLTAEGGLSGWISYECHLVQSFTITSAPGRASSTFGLATGEGLRYQALDLSVNWVDAEKRDADFFVDRLNMRLAFPWFDLTVGRQAITFGKAYFWNPLDVFLPFDPRQFDRDYKAGVDAFRFDLPLGAFSGLTAVAAAGREITPSGDFKKGNESWRSEWYASALLARAYTNWRDWDLAIQGGKVYGGRQVGAAAAGEIGPLELRLEGAWLSADKSLSLPFPINKDLIESHFSGVIGLGHRFASSLTVEAEYLYNGAGSQDNLDAALYRAAAGVTTNLSRHVVGWTLSYEVAPLCTARVAALLAPSPISAQIQPSLQVSLSDEMDMLVGVIVNLGDRPEGRSALVPDLQSEFGAQSNFLYVELKVYF